MLHVSVFCLRHMVFMFDILILHFLAYVYVYTLVWRASLYLDSYDRQMHSYLQTYIYNYIYVYI